jgi:drug/metabolite transporter (DMT)-like permease
MYCFYYALAGLRLADAVLLAYTLPLFMPIIAYLWLKEQVSPRVWWAVGSGFVGVALVLKPTAGIFNPVALIGLLAGVFGALAQVTVRKLTGTEPVTRIVLYFAALTSLISLVPATRADVVFSTRILLLLILLGLLATTGQIFLTRGYSVAPAAQVGPFVYSAIVFGGLLDWLIWNHIPDAAFLFGAVLICLGGFIAMTGQRGSEEDYSSTQPPRDEGPDIGR